MKYFLDSNIFVYAKINDRVYGECCQRIVRMVYEGRIGALIDSVVLLEVANALRKLGIKDVEDEVLAILSLPIMVVEITKEDITQAIRNQTLLPYDAVHSMISRRARAKIISADKDFDAAGDRIDPCSFTS